MFFSQNKEQVCFQSCEAKWSECSSSEHPSMDFRCTVIMVISPSVVRHYCPLFKDPSSLSSGFSPIMPPSCHCMCRCLHRPTAHPSPKNGARRGCPGIATNVHSASRTLAQSIVSPSLISSALGNGGQLAVGKNMSPCTILCSCCCFLRQVLSVWPWLL